MNIHIRDFADLDATKVKRSTQGFPTSRHGFEAERRGCWETTDLHATWTNPLAQSSIVDDWSNNNEEMTVPSTKERILNAAEEIMLTKSFHSVGLNEILRAVNVPKGSFYHHFRSKEQFGVELLKHYLNNASDDKKRMLLSAEIESNPRQRLLTFLESSIASFLSNNGRCPCLIVKLGPEVATFSEPMRMVLAAGREEWAQITESVVSEGIAKKCIRSDVDPRQTAELLESLWTGAMQHAAISKKAEPLRDALNFISSNLLPAP